MTAERRGKLFKEGITMKKQWKGFVTGVVATILILGFVLPAFAAYQKQATLNYNDIKVTLDGKQFTPTDANGNAVEPFVIDGTTFLPVRAVANALGLEVGWNGETKTVTLNNQVSASKSHAETVLVEKNGIKITYTGIDYDRTFGPKVKLLIENNSDKTYIVQARECSVNGFMIDPVFSSDVASGKKANEGLTLMKRELEKNGITSIETVELHFKIANSNDWSDSFETVKVTINCK